MESRPSVLVKSIPFGLCLAVYLAGIGCGPSSSGPLRGETPPAPAATVSADIATPADPAAPGRAGTYAGEWSEPVNELSARLIVRLEDTQYRSIYSAQVTLEVKNTSRSPVSFISQPHFTDIVLRDADGLAVPNTDSFPGNYLRGLPEWAVIPGNAYLGIRVDTPLRVEEGMFIGNVTFDKQNLSATLVSVRQEGPENQWTGEIALPEVTLSPTIDN